MTKMQQVEKWINKISSAEKKYNDYYNLIKETRDFYKDNRGLGNKSGHYNIFWSTIETLKPFLYFKQPKPFVERSNKTAGKVEKLACDILSKALQWNLEQFDFDSIIKYARNDFLISGCGIVWERYFPEFELIPSAQNPECLIEVKRNEKVISEYVNPEHFLADCDEVGIWENVTWIARKIYMSKSQAIDVFGEQACINLVLENETDYKNKEVCIYEIWDKDTAKVYWLAKEKTDDFLRVADNPLKIKGFFPCPKPIFATLTNDSIIPVPDYCLIRELLNELNGIHSRMRLTMQALKVSGAYDNSFPELANILNKDVTLVAAKDFQRLKDCGGLKGILDFIPIEQYIIALEQLAQRRQDIISQIYEVTGVSDIMRGNSKAEETATAVVQKTNFGTLRNQDRQNDMQRFIKDLFAIKAEIICEQFSATTLLEFLPEDQRVLAEAQAAVTLLKDEKMRGMILEIENDNVFNAEAEAEKTLNGIKSLNDLISGAFSVVSQQPLLLPLYRSMIESVCSSLPKARPFEAVIEKVFASLEADLGKPETQQPNPQIEMQQQQLNIEKEKNQLKARELDIKEKAEENKANLTMQEMNFQAGLKLQQLADERKKQAKGLDPVVIKEAKPIPVEPKKINTNISTGKVKGF
ncbi:MAG: hypothetical protein E7019_06355 [Alphaproteobacteria bacterium]|nr:hypothetical protein [Alphaproteobacteria bacterium]